MPTPVEYQPPDPVRQRQRRMRWGRVARRAMKRTNGQRGSGTRPIEYTFMPGVIEGVGQISPWELSSPSVALWRRGASNYPTSGVGQNGDAGAVAFGLTAGMIVAVVVVAGIVNYQLGKAMAPNEASEPKWAWGNAIGGTLFPPFTLGMAVYKNYIR